DGADRSVDPDTLRLKLTNPHADRIFYLAQAFQDGMSIDDVFELTKIDRWFLRNVEQIVAEAQALRNTTLKSAGPGRNTSVSRAKKLGFSDRQLAFAATTGENEIRTQRISAGVLPTYRLVDTCAAEFEAYT